MLSRGGAACLLVLAFMCASPAADAQSTRRGIEVEEAWIRPPTRQTPEPYAFFTIINNTDRDERLVSVVTRGGTATLARLHLGLKTFVERVEYIDVPAYRSLKLKPGGDFVMLRDSGKDLMPGYTLTLTLRFQNAGSRDIEVPITNQLLGNMGRPKP